MRRGGAPPCSRSRDPQGKRPLRLSAISLSDALRRALQEHRAAEEAIQTHSLQVQQFERDRDLLQQAISKLEQDLSEARRAQDSLDDQKQENVRRDTVFC